MGNVHFDLEAGKIIFNKRIIFIFLDLTPLFNWNTKQLFVYVVVEYVTPKHVRTNKNSWKIAVIYFQHRV